MALFGKRKPTFKSVFAHSKQFPMSAVLAACQNQPDFLTNKVFPVEAFELRDLYMDEETVVKSVSTSKGKGRSDTPKKGVSKTSKPLESLDRVAPLPSASVAKSSAKKIQEKTAPTATSKDSSQVKPAAKSTQKKEAPAAKRKEPSAPQAHPLLMTVLPQKTRSPVVAKIIETLPMASSRQESPESIRIGVSLLQSFVAPAAQVPVLDPKTLFFDTQLLDPVLSEIPLISESLMPVDAQAARYGTLAVLDENLLGGSDGIHDTDAIDSEMSHRVSLTLNDNIISFPHSPRPVEPLSGDTVEIVSISDEVTTRSEGRQSFFLDDVLGEALDLNLLDGDEAAFLSESVSLVEPDQPQAERASIMGFDESRLQASGARLLRIVHKLESNWLLLAQRPEAMILLADDGEGMSLLKTFAGIQWSPEALLESQLTRLPRKTLCSIRIGDWQGIVCDDQRGVRLEAEVKVLEA